MARLRDTIKDGTIDSKDGRPLTRDDAPPEGFERFERYDKAGVFITHEPIPAAVIERNTDDAALAAVMTGPAAATTHRQLVEAQRAMIRRLGLV